MSAGNRRGFSLVEAVVAAAITGVGVTAALGAVRAMIRSDYESRQTELMASLAREKYDEVIATREYTSAPLTGDFKDRNFEGYAFRVETEPSGTENLDILRVTVNRSDKANELAGKLTGLVFVPPTPTEGGQ